MELGNLLSAIKGGGQLNQPTNRNIVAAEADEVSDPGYMSRKIRKFRTDKFDTFNEWKF